MWKIEPPTERCFVVGNAANMPLPWRKKWRGEIGPQKKGVQDILTRCAQVAAQTLHSRKATSSRRNYNW